MSHPDRTPATAEFPEVPARFTYVGRPDTEARVRVRRHDSRQRTARALRVLGACWGLAVVAVLVPVLHFVLVPGLLLAGPLLAVQRLGERVTVVGARGECPGCGAPQTFTLAMAPTERMPLRCEACGRQVFLVPGAELTDPA
jgi:hypothetical protein